MAEYHFRNLVFEGGGVKGIGYAGVLAVLEEKGILPGILRVGGTSAGAITAAMVGLGYELAEIENELRNLNFKNFLDADWGIVRNTERLLEEYGWYRGEFFLKWMGELIEKKTSNAGITFGQWTEKKRQGGRELYFMGTNLSTGYSEVFSAETTPDMAIRDAVRISMSIPLFFAAKRNSQQDVMVDGGVLDNYPVKLFDRKRYVDVHYADTEYYAELNRQLGEQGGNLDDAYVFNKETLGFRLDSGSQIAVFQGEKPPERKPINDFFDYGSCLMNTILEAQQNQHLHSDDWQRTIYVDTLGVKTTQFDIDEDTKNALIKSGRSGAEKYFLWYDQTAAASNKP